MIPGIGSASIELVQYRDMLPVNEFDEDLKSIFELELVSSFGRPSR